MIVGLGCRGALTVNAYGTALAHEAVEADGAQPQLVLPSEGLLIG